MHGTEDRWDKQIKKYIGNDGLAFALCIMLFDEFDKSLQFWLLFKTVSGVIVKIRSRIQQGQEALHTPGQ